MAATTRNRNSNVNKDVFPPTDRELALRGEIKTGWSTLALHQNLKNLGLSQAEVSKIEKVLKRAETVERVNQLRIGVELMKHRQKKESSLGDGERTCLICGIDFSSHGQYRRKPVAVNFCDKCSFAVCSSCMLGNEKQSGDGVTLCPLCSEEKEIWKRSGAWFNNTLPVIDISKEELEKFEQQQKLSQSRAFTLGKHTDETTAREFVNPYQLEADSEESEDEELNTLHLRKSITPEPPAAAAASSSFPPPISFVDKPHLQPALQRPSAYKPAASSTFPQGTPSPLDALAEFRDRSGMTGLESSEPVGQRLQPLGGEESGGRTQRIVRRGAMSTLDKTRLDTSRKRVLGTFGVPDSPTSPTELEFAKTSPRILVNGGDGEGERKPRQHPIPPQHPPPKLLPLDEEKSDQSSKVDVVVESSTAKPRKPVVKRRREKEGEERAAKPLEDEFKKVAVAPLSSTEQSALPPPSKKPPVLSASSATDEFRKVGIVAVATTPPSTTASKPPPPNKPAPIHEADEFRKVTPKSKPPPRAAGGSGEQEEFKKVDTRPESPTRKPAIPPRDEFRKVSPPKEVKKPSPPPVTAETDEFRKVSATKKSPPPPPKMELDEFRKVGITALATTSPSSKPPSLPSKPANFYDTRSSVERDVPPKRVSMSPPTAKNPPREEAGEVPPPLPEKPSHFRGEVKQESPRRLPDLPSVVVSERHSEGDRKSITSTSSLTSQSSRKSPPTDSLPREQSPFSASITVTNEEETVGSSLTKNGSPIRRQGEIDEDQPSLFRRRSGAVRGGSRGRSRSPGARQQQQTPEEVKPEAKNDNKVTDELDDFQPRARSRSGAVDSRTPPRRGVRGGNVEETTPPPPVPLRRGVRGGSIEETSPPPPVPLQRGVRGGSAEETPPPPPVPLRRAVDGGSIEETSPLPPPVPSVRTMRTVQPVVPPRQNSAGSQDETVSTTPPSDDAVHPRMRTRSRAYHGDARRPRLQQQHQLAGNRSIKEDSPTNDADLSQPRMRSRSRVLRGDSQRPKKFTRTPSPSPAAAQPAAAQSMGAVGEQSSLEVPNSGMRPRSSSTGQRNTEFDHSSTDTPKPEGAFGSVELEIEYVEGENLLKVTIARCKGLRAMDGNGYSDPYVKLFLLPGNKIHKFQTRTIHKNLDPVFDETFMFYSVSMEAMKSKQLCLIVMDYDEFSADDFIGSTKVKLYEVLYSQSYKINIRRLLDDNIVAQTALEDKTRGRVRLSFSYSMEKEVFSIYVHKAEQLVPQSTKGLCDPYVKCYFDSCGTGSCVKKKTSVSRKTLTPVFDQVLEFSEKLIHLSLAYLTVSVWDRSKLPAVEIGSVQFKDAIFWKQFLAHPNLTVTEWYVLYAPDHHAPRNISPKNNNHVLTLPRKYL